MNNHDEVKEIKKIIKCYKEGTYEGNREKLKSVFHEMAVMNGYLGEEVLMGTPEPFIKDMAENPSMKSGSESYSAEIEYMNIEGRIATVILSESAFRGKEDMSNHFQLIKTKDGWKIISKLFTTL